MRDIFEEELQKPTVFLNRNVLSPHYIPETLPHREKEIESIMKTLAPILNGKISHNLFLYGKTGTGKTASIKYVLEKLQEKKEKYGVKIDQVYVNCRIINTKYQILLKCAEYCYPEEKFVGFPFSHLFDKILNNIRAAGQNYIIVLDELDKVRDLDDLIYTLTRANDELGNGHISLIGITNSITFKKELDPRSKSTLCEQEMVFPPYNAEQLADILLQRSKIGFKKDTVDPSAISFASALAAQESGDARYALKLLLKAGEVADNFKAEKVIDEHIKSARKGVEEEIVYELINTLPDHQKIVLYACAVLTEQGGKTTRLDGTHDEHVLFSGEIYEKYEHLCNSLAKTPRSARWCREYINDLEMLGLLTTAVSGKGFRGNTTLVRLAFPADKVKAVILKSLGPTTSPAEAKKDGAD
ncbi:MAG: orc1/cdc6 family replication initiation protein [Candidatus Micrarchaeota archaeon]